MTQTETRALFRAAIVAVAPAVLLAGLVWHPFYPGPRQYDHVVRDIRTEDMIPIRSY